MDQLINAFIERPLQSVIKTGCVAIGVCVAAPMIRVIIHEVGTVVEEAAYHTNATVKALLE